MYRAQIYVSITLKNRVNVVWTVHVQSITVCMYNSLQTWTVTCFDNIVLQISAFSISAIGKIHFCPFAQV